jgi:hypothetical protein
MRYSFWKTGFLINGVLPFGFIISLLTFYFHATVILGHFPKYNRPDPKNLDSYEVYSVFISTTGILWMVSFFLTIPLVITYLTIKRKNSNWKLIAFSFISQTIAVLLFLSNVSEWYFD